MKYGITLICINQLFNQLQVILFDIHNVEIHNIFTFNLKFIHKRVELK